RQSLKFANTYRRLASPADYERSRCQPVLNASDLRPLSSEPQSQQGVVGPRGGKAFVDDPAERLDAGAPQVLLKASGLRSLGGPELMDNSNLEAFIVAGALVRRHPDR